MSHESWHTELFGDGFWTSRRSQCSKTRSCRLSLIFHKKSGDRFLYDQHNAVESTRVYRGENRSAQMKRNNVFGRRIADSKQIGEPKWAGQSWWFRMSEWPARSTSKCSTPKRSTMCQMIFDLKVWMICKWAFETLWSRLHSFTIWRPLNFLHKIHFFEMKIGNKSQKFKLLYSMGTNNDSHAVQAVLGRFTAWAALKSSRIW